MAGLFEKAVDAFRARLWLSAVSVRGPGVTVVGRPRIDNQGTLLLGARAVLRSAQAPIELAAGPGARLEIGEDVRINSGVSIGATGSVRIGARVRIDAFAMIIDSEFHDLYDREQRPPPRPVVIEDDVCIGAKAAILPGVTVGRGAVVATGSVVSSDVPPHCEVAGVPARVVRELRGVD